MRGRVARYLDNVLALRDSAGGDSDLTALGGEVLDTRRADKAGAEDQDLLGRTGCPRRRTVEDGSEVGNATDEWRGRSFA